MVDRSKHLENQKRWRNSESGRRWRSAYLPANRDKISDQNRRYRDAHKDDINDKNRELRKSRKANPIDAPFWVRRKMLRDACNRAEVKGLIFSLKMDDIASPAVCPVLGIALDWTRSKPGANSPSLDRIVNSKGYTPENVWVISRRANVIKSDATPDELRVVADAVDAILHLKDRKGGTPEEWPEDLRVREMPEGRS